MNKTIAAAVVSAGMFLSTPVWARQVEVHITNLTNGVYFTPLLVAAHNRHTPLFEVGTQASEHLQAMAEGGEIGGLIADLEVAGGAYVEDPAEGLLAPGVPGVPADPGGHGGTGATGVAGPDYNDSVHVHRGVSGDTDPEGGPSDLDSRVHRWLNPVARVVVEVK